jgi:uncharacterized protein YigA (DUF484 family)
MQSAMADTDTKDRSSELDAESVRAYLRDHPDLVREDGELMALIARIDAGDGIVDLGAAARSKLLEEVRQLKALNTGIVETARANLAIQSQVHMAVLGLLESESMATLDRKIAGRVTGALGIDVCRVYIEGHAPLPSGEAILGCSEGLIADVLGQKIERLGPVDEALGKTLYGAQGTRVKSHAIVRLDFNGHDGLLAIAARDPHLFQMGQGTELLNFLGRSIERLIVRWLHES